MPVPWIACAYIEAFLPTISLFALSVLTLEQCWGWGWGGLQRDLTLKNLTLSIRERRNDFVASVGQSVKGC